MSYYISKKTDYDFDQAIDRVTEELKSEGFGVLTEIDVKATFKKKLDVDFTDYRILGACKPQLAYQAIQGEPFVGTMLPCNVIVRKDEEGKVVVAAVNPVASMQAIDNPRLGEVAGQVRDQLTAVINRV